MLKVLTQAMRVAAGISAITMMPSSLAVADSSRAVVIKSARLFDSVSGKLTEPGLIVVVVVGDKI
jgi:hypothetical protein